MSEVNAQATVEASKPEVKPVRTQKLFTRPAKATVKLAPEVAETPAPIVAEPAPQPAPTIIKPEPKPPVVLASQVSARTRAEMEAGAATLLKRTK
jgi:hypothetical protein